MHKMLSITLPVVLLAGAQVALPAEPPTAELIEKASGGDAGAQLSLDVRYRDGKGVARNDAEAMRWAHLAADKGGGALDFVGWMFFRGTGVRHDPKRAFGYFNAAADRSLTAAWNLGQCYFAAQGVGQEIPKALEVCKKAARMGHGPAASTAAMMYSPAKGSRPTRLRPASSRNARRS